MINKRERARERKREKNSKTLRETARERASEREIEQQKHNLYGARHPTDTETQCKERAVDEADSKITHLERHRFG